jgi:biotin carboxylase
MWFDNYKIASLYEWDVTLQDAPGVYALSEMSPNVKLPKMNTQSLLRNEDFRNMMARHLDGYSILTYKPIDVPEALAMPGVTFLSTDTDLASNIENKAYFRRHFAPLGLPFPKFRIYDYDAPSVPDMDIQDVLGSRSRVIVQDAQLRGGRGTYVVDNEDSLQYAKKSIELLGASGSLVVSDMIENARERSVQCVATRYGVFVGPLQKQIIAHPLLSNVDVVNGDKFCGAEISNDDVCAGAYEEIKKYALIIGAELQRLGYKGIFGVDCLVAGDGKVYVLEVNPRITGVTPLLTMLYREGRDIPFYLLHILELMNADYEIEDETVEPIPAEGALLIVHAQNMEPVRLAESPASGIYDQNLAYVKAAIRFDNSPSMQFLVHQYAPGLALKPGGRVMNAFINKSALNPDDTLRSDVAELVTSMMHRVKLDQL